MDRGLMRADLNLLKVLHVLLEERNVRRAAERLFVTQSAVSRSLSRLRQLFDDPLLVRSSHGLVPTERALQIAAVVGDTIQRIDGLLKPPPFDPRLAHGTIQIASPESFAFGAIPQLTRTVKNEAPGLSLTVGHLPDDYLAMLEAGSLDFAINHDQPYPDAFIRSPLMQMTPLFWFRRGHPLEQRREITLNDVVSYPVVSFHAQNVSREGYRLLMQLIQDEGRPPPQILIDTSHLLVALDVLMMTEAIMLGPEHLMRIPTFEEKLAARPMETLQTLGRGQTKLCLIQHERTVRSPLHMWMSEQIQSSFRSQ